MGGFVGVVYVCKISNSKLQTPNSPFKALIEDAKFLLQRCNCSLIHTLREGNKVADLLANLGVAQSEHVLFLEDPPTEATAFLINDMLGVPAMRD